MKTYILIALLVIVCAFLLGASETTRKVQWEYGTLENRYIDKDNSLWIWSTGPSVVIGNSLVEFCVKMKHPEMGPLNGLGAEGWELINGQMIRLDKYETDEKYWFKRPK
jgi:hypothetical protein